MSVCHGVVEEGYNIALSLRDPFVVYNIEVFMVPPYHLLASGRDFWGEGKYFKRRMENSECVLIPFSPNHLNSETISKREFLK